MQYSCTILDTFYSDLGWGIVVKLAITMKIPYIICEFHPLAFSHHYSLLLLRKLSKYIYNWNSTYIVIQWMVDIFILFQCSFLQFITSKCKVRPSTEEGDFLLNIYPDQVDSSFIHIYVAQLFVSIFKLPAITIIVLLTFPKYINQNFW